MSGALDYIHADISFGESMWGGLPEKSAVILQAACIIAGDDDKLNKHLKDEEKKAAVQDTIWVYYLTCTRDPWDFNYPQEKDNDIGEALNKIDTANLGAVWLDLERHRGSKCDYTEAVETIRAYPHKRTKKLADRDLARLRHFIVTRLSEEKLAVLNLLFFTP